MDFGIGGLAAVCAGFFTNPLEVIKVRMQLQGELRQRGKHAVHYKNVFHAGYVIAKHDGILALQAGLVPALWVQLVLNGVRLGSYQTLATMGLLKNSKGEPVVWKSAVASGLCGTAGAMIGSPIYLVKTHLQAKANTKIAFGHQHTHGGMIRGLMNIYNTHGILGLFRGSTAAIPRAFLGSSAQLTSFGYCKEKLMKYEISKRPILTSFIASLIGGVAVAVVMTPFDLVMTRLYNQGVDKSGRGLLYNSYIDCVFKIYGSEGFFGFYKGLSAAYFRLGPHTVLSLVFWDYLKNCYMMYTKKNEL